LHCRIRFLQGFGKHSFLRRSARSGAR
jgi:hypothetical protein